MDYQIKISHLSRSLGRRLFMFPRTDLSFSCHRLDGDVRLIVAFLAEGYDTIAESEQCVVGTHTHVFTRVVHGTTLTYDNVTCLCELTTKDLHAKTFAF